MAVASIRPYRGGDEEAIVACWNRSMPKDTIALKVFIDKVLCDPNFDPEGCLVAVDPQGAVCGFLLALVRRLPLAGTDLEPEDGWITTFAVDPAYRRQGVGRALMAAAEAFFRARGRRRISFSPYAPNYFLPGIDPDTYPEGAAFLRACGFQRLYSPVAMDKNIVRFEIPEDVRQTQQARLAEGYQFIPLTPAYVVETIRFAHEKFNPDWGRAVREAILRGLPFDQFLLALSPEGRVVGFCLYGGYDGIPERFGPFGVDESQRGKGLGKVLLYLCLDQMRAKGLHNAWFLWTGETSPAGQLYKRCGFTITRRFDVMRKVLD